MFGVEGPAGEEHQTKWVSIRELLSPKGTKMQATHLGWLRWEFNALVEWRAHLKNNDLWAWGPRLNYLRDIYLSLTRRKNKAEKAFRDDIQKRSHWVTELTQLGEMLNLHMQLGPMAIEAEMNECLESPCPLG